MYSRTDSFGLERKSKYHPITIQEIRKAVEKEKAPILLAEQAADKVAKAALIEGVRELIYTGLNTEKVSVNVSETQPSPTAISHGNPTTAGKSEKKKRGLRWYHWVFIVVMVYVVFNFVLPVIGAYILWRMGYI
jgi:phenylpyruvate tautomerase PptA (4-oxalocrotonate tautomerase family)